MANITTTAERPQYRFHQLEPFQQEDVIFELDVIMDQLQALDAAAAARNVPGDSVKVLVTVVLTLVLRDLENVYEALTGKTEGSC